MNFRFAYFICKNTDDPKVTYVVVDFDKLEEYASTFQLGHDICFCCLGTTRKDAGSAEAFRKVDYDYVVKAADLCDAANIPRFSLVSSKGASSSSFFPYMKTKGQVEDRLKQIDFHRLSIFQPGLLDRGADARFGEKIASIFGSISTRTVAMAMLYDAKTKNEHKGECKTFTNRQIRDMELEAAKTFAATK